jgi:hypothetical protein
MNKATILVLGIACALAAGIQGAEPTTEQTIVSTSPDGTQSISILDKQGSPKETKNLKADGSLRSRIVYERDGTGKVLKATTYDADGKLHHSDAYAYDFQSRVISVSRTTAAGWVLTCQKQYDSRGDEAGTRCIGHDGREITAAEWDKAAD